MEERMKSTLAYAKKLAEDPCTDPEKKEALRKELLTLIGFMQHERTIHLMVTLTFALLSIGSVLALSFDPPQPLIFGILALLFMVLLVPYIRHYFVLENGVQRLFHYYDLFTGNGISSVLRRF